MLCLPNACQKYQYELSNTKGPAVVPGHASLASNPSYDVFEFGGAEQLTDVSYALLEWPGHQRGKNTPLNSTAQQSTHTLKNNPISK